MKPPINIIRLPRTYPHLRYLHLEEALFRHSSRNWCVLASPQIPPTAVLGLAGKPEALLHLDAIRSESVPTIRRFTGGGTVVVNEDTLLAGLICNATDAGMSDPKLIDPKALMRWAADLGCGRAAGAVMCGWKTGGVGRSRCRAHARAHIYGGESLLAGGDYEVPQFIAHTHTCMVEESLLAGRR